MLVANPNAPIATPQPAAATQTPSPCLRTRVIQPEKTDATSAPADGAAYSSPTRRGAAPERLAERGEERARHPEDHRHRVDGEDPEQRGLANDQPEPVENRAQAHTLRVLDLRQARQEPDRDERGAEGREVEAVGAREADGADQQAGECGPATRERLNTTSSTAIAASS